MCQRRPFAGWISVALLLFTVPAYADHTYTTTADFDQGVLNSTNDTAIPDQVQLNATSSTEPFIWVANWIDGTVTKVNTDTGRQVGRYDSVLQTNWDGTPNNVRPPREFGTFPPCTNAGGNTPSRTAVDGDGNAFVANRAFCFYPSLTKFAGSIASCVDRNNNGIIDTSNDANGDGQVNINDPAEFKGQADECLLWTKNTLTFGDWGRSAAVDANQNVWVAGFNSGVMEQRNGADGHLMATIDPVAEGTSEACIYGLAIGPGGFIYNSDICGGVIRKVDPTAGAGHHIVSTMHAGYGTYGLAVDKNSVVWLADWTGPGGVVRMDFNANTVALMGANGGGCGFGPTRGVGVDGDGHIWVSCYSANQILEFDSAGNLLLHRAVDSGPIGVGIDGRGSVWTANQVGNSLTRYNPSLGTTNTFTLAPGFHNSQPYSYSDMTGFQQRNFTSRQGSWSVIYDGGKAAQAWGTVSFNAENQGSIPAGTTIDISVRASDTQASLASLPFVSETNNVEFLGVTGRFIEVKAVLRILSGNAGPILSDLTIKARIVPPTALCADQSTCAANGTCQAAASINNGSNDSQGNTFTLTQTPPGPYSIGTYDPVKLSAANQYGSTTCTAKVTVKDCEPPTITCPANVTAECTGDASATVTPGAANATDLCTGATVSDPPAQTFALGAPTVVVHRAVDGAGNKSSCTQSITVVDTKPPMIQCPAAQTAECTGMSSANVTVAAATASDICTSTTVTGGSGSSTYGLGTTPLAFHAADRSGNTADCTTSVTVVDTKPPSIVCPADAVAECTGNSSAFVTPSAAQASDICAAATVQGPAAQSYPLGTTPVVYTATDGVGLKNSCKANIVVRDTLPPSITCPPQVVAECTNGKATVNPGVATATDQCAPPTVVNAAPGVFSLGTTVTNFSAVDGVGHTVSCTSSVKVQDTTPPVVTVNGGSPNASEELWPPNHKMRTIDVLADCGITATDACQGAVTLTNANLSVDCVTSNEPFLINGSGNTDPDIIIINRTTVQLRPERAGGLTGRVYKVGFTVTDAAGNKVSGVCRIDVPHDQSPKGGAVDNGVVAEKVCF